MTIIEASALSIQVSEAMSRSQMSISAKLISETLTTAFARINKPVVIASIDIISLSKIRVTFDSLMRMNAALLDPENYQLIAPLQPGTPAIPPNPGGNPPAVVTPFGTYHFKDGYASVFSTIENWDAAFIAFKAAHDYGFLRVEYEPGLFDDWQYYIITSSGGPTGQPSFTLNNRKNGLYHILPVGTIPYNATAVVHMDYPMDLHHGLPNAVLPIGTTQFSPSFGTVNQTAPEVPASASMLFISNGTQYGPIYTGGVYTPPPAGTYGNGLYTIPGPGLTVEVPASFANYASFFTPRPGTPSPGVPAIPAYKAAELFFSEIIPERAANPTFVDIVLETEMTTDGEYELQIETEDGPVSVDDDPFDENTFDETFLGVGENPQVQAVEAISANRVDVIFTEQMKINDAIKDPSNYEFDNGLQVLSVVGVDGNRVMLVTSDQEPGELYTLTVAP